MSKITREEWRELTPEQQWQYVEVIEALLAERERLLAQIPPCFDHGQHCIPHAREWIEQHVQNRA